MKKVDLSLSSFGLVTAMRNVEESTYKLQKIYFLLLPYAYIAQCDVLGHFLCLFFEIKCTSSDNYLVSQL